jgi:hypothetical protein
VTIRDAVNSADGGAGSRCVRSRPEVSGCVASMAGADSLDVEIADGWRGYVIIFGVAGR